MNWQPIDTAPKDGTDILLFYPSFVRGVQLGHYDVYETLRHGKSTYRSEGWNIGSMISLPGMEKPEPTHWMPLPVNPPLGGL